MARGTYSNNQGNYWCQIRAQIAGIKTPLHYWSDQKYKKSRHLEMVKHSDVRRSVQTLHPMKSLYIYRWLCRIGADASGAPVPPTNDQIFRLVVAPCNQKKIRRGSTSGRFSGDCFSAILTKFKGRRMVSIWPRTSRTIETIGLVC